MGNEAIALGALRAGINLASGYPGTPSSEILETIAKNRRDGVYVEWSVNEKSALEVAAGASIAGARSLVTMKQVGLNVASDPLMSLNYVGIKGGMVVVVCDDPGPISSQTEQDSRVFGRYGKFMVFDPSTPGEAYQMVADAFEYSERIGRPVLLRPTTRVCHSYESIELLEDKPQKIAEGFSADNGKWVIFPRLSYQSHITIEETLRTQAKTLSDYPGNFSVGTGSKGIAAGGVTWQYLNEVLDNISEAVCKRMKVSTYPVAEGIIDEFFEGLDEVLVLEELDPYIEDELNLYAKKVGQTLPIKGKRTGDTPVAGELTLKIVEDAIRKFLSLDEAATQTLPPLPALSGRAPVLCPGCPHRASFYSVKQAMKNTKCTFSGDIGCYTLGNSLPLDMVDTCLCMGAGITEAQGLSRIEPETLHFAFIGDSTFFASGITGLINAVYNKTPIIVVILDNSTTAMTGGQPHPGSGKTISGSGKKIEIAKLVEAIGVDAFYRVNPFDLDSAVQAAKDAAHSEGVRVILFEAPCIMLSGNQVHLEVDTDTCTGCEKCVKDLGCPAIHIEEEKASIDPGLCNGCTLCQNVCPFGALSKVVVR
jgi:indolepyruvate ferredoxin oxidoreductase alpha subunit